MTMFDGMRDKAPLTALPLSHPTKMEVKVGEAIDLKGYNAATFMVMCGAGEAGGSFELILEEAEKADMTDAALVDASEMTVSEPLGPVDDGDAGRVFALSYHGMKRYVRLSADIKAANNIEKMSDALGVELRNVTEESDAIDLGAIHGDVIIMVTAGAITDGDHALSMTHSDDDGVEDPYAAIEAADIDVALPTIDNTMLAGTSVHRYLGKKRYIKIASTVTPGVTGGIYGVMVLQQKGGPRYGAVALLEHARHQ